MTKSQSKDCLTLDLKGNLPLEKFEKGIVAFFDLIKEVTKAAPFLLGLRRFKRETSRFQNCLRARQ